MRKINKNTIWEALGVEFRDGTPIAIKDFATLVYPTETWYWNSDKDNWLVEIDFETLGSGYYRVSHGHPIKLHGSAEVVVDHLGRLEIQLEIGATLEFRGRIYRQ